MLLLSVCAAPIVRPGSACGERPVPVDPVPFVERPLEDELILEVRVRNHVLSDAIFAYRAPEGALLPLAELARALEFPIIVDAEAGTAEGWFLRRHRTFALDLVGGWVDIAGERRALPPGGVERHSDDIYVRSDVIAQWLPVDLEVDRFASSLWVVPREPLPFEERLLREQRAARLGRGPGEARDYPAVPVPYRFLDWPFVDLALNLEQRRETPAVPEGEREVSRSASYSAFVAGDLLWSEMNLYLRGDNEENPREARFALARRDPYGMALGLTEVVAGDVFTPQLPLIAQQTEGRGLLLSSFPLARASEFDRTTLRGDVPPGWEVELYRNGALLEFQRVGEDGRYEFADVSLLFGLNEFRIILYGPQGQRRERLERVLVGAGLAPPGTVRYRLAANRQHVDTLRVGPRPLADEPEYGQPRASLELEAGLSQRIAAALSGASYPLGEIRRRYSALGLRAAVLGAFLRLDAAWDVTSKTELARDSREALLRDELGYEPRRRAYEASLQTRLWGLDLLLVHGGFQEFVSERYPFTIDPLVARDSLRLDFTVPPWLLPALFVTLSGERQERRSGAFTADAVNRLALGAGPLSVANTLRWHALGTDGEVEQKSLQGTFRLSARPGRFSIRGEVAYDLKPDNRTTDVQATTEYRFASGTTARLAVARELRGDKTDRYSIGLARDLGGATAGFSASYADDDSYVAGLSLAMGFGREPRRGDWALLPRGSARSGAASARVFIDENGNRRYDEGEPPLQGVRFARRRGAETGEDGIALVTGLSAYHPTPLTIDVGTLEDPYLRPATEGVEIVPRPGRPALLDFPVTRTGEIDGTVFLQRGGRQQPASNVVVQLLDNRGRVLRDTRSAFDGFYLFEFVPHGAYAVRVSPEQARQYRLRAGPGRAVRISPQADIAVGMDLVLQREERPTP